MTSGKTAVACSMASNPLAASTTPYPLKRRNAAYIVRLSSKSSTMRTVGGFSLLASVAMHFLSGPYRSVGPAMRREAQRRKVCGVLPAPRPRPQRFRSGRANGGVPPLEMGRAAFRHGRPMRVPTTAVRLNDHISRVTMGLVPPQVL